MSTIIVDLLNIDSVCLFLIIIVLTSIIVYLFEFYSKIKSYPNGLTPIPVIGNLLSLVSNRKVHPLIKFSDIGKKYGKLMTFWMGSQPVIMIFDLDLGREMFMKTTFSGRPELVSLTENNQKAFLLMDYGSEMLQLRRVSVEALRKMLATNRIPNIVNAIVEDTVNVINASEGDKPFNPHKYLSHIFYSSLSAITFGKVHRYGDRELNETIDWFEALLDEVAVNLIADFMPAIKPFVKLFRKKHNSKINVNEIYARNFAIHKEEHVSDRNDNFAHSLLTAKNKLLNEGKESANYMTDANLTSTLVLLFVAGSETSISTFLWQVLFLAYYPDIQRKLRDEVKREIGERLPASDDIVNCHYVKAFRYETLRFRSVAPIGFFHKALTDIEIDGRSIPKGTALALHLWSILHDEKYWKNPQTFSPERFLDSQQKFSAENMSAFVPFGVGKRMCVGDKLTNDVSFIAITRLLQTTDGYSIELVGDKHDDMLDVPHYGWHIEPKPYNIIFKKICD